MFRIYKHQWKDAKTGEKKQSSNWYCQFSHNGVRTAGRSTGTTNKAEATKIGMQWLRQFEQSHDSSGKPVLTVKEALTQWHATRKNDKRLLTWVRKLQGISFDKQSQEEVTVAGLDPNRPFSAVTMGDVQRLITARLAAGNSTATVLNELSVLSNTVEHWKRNEHPVPKIDFKELKRGNQLKPSKHRTRFLELDEAKRLLHELHPNTPVKVAFGVSEVPDAESSVWGQRQDLYDLATILLLTGARYSEIAKLQWRQVDLKNRRFFLYRFKVKNESIKPLNDTLYAVFKRRYDSRGDNEFVFTAKNGTSRNYAPGAFQRACERAGLTGVTFHTLRHTFASWMAQKGFTLQEIAQELGHATITMSQRYAHLMPNQAAHRVSEAIDL